MASGASKAKYALHRSIGGSYDVFTSVMDDAPDDDKLWRQSKRLGLVSHCLRRCIRLKTPA